MVAIIQQIQSALNNSENFNERDQERFKAILKKYLSEEAEIEEIYYDLLDSDLVPMLSRCYMYSSIDNDTQDEEKLKLLINNKVFNND